MHTLTKLVIITSLIPNQCGIVLAAPRHQHCHHAGAKVGLLSAGGNCTILGNAGCCSGNCTAKACVAKP